MGDLNFSGFDFNWQLRPFRTKDNFKIENKVKKDMEMEAGSGLLS